MVWNWILFGDVDDRSEKKDSTYIASSRVHRSSSRIQDVVVWRDTIPITHVWDRQEPLVLKRRKSVRVLGIV